MKLNHIRYGNGKPLLLIHGLGGSWRSWMAVLDRLAAHREIIAIDLPGHGKTPSLEGDTTIATLADAVPELIWLPLKSQPYPHLLAYYDV